jgi:hypothetical protein
LVARSGLQNGVFKKDENNKDKVEHDEGMEEVNNSLILG